MRRATVLFALIVVGLLLLPSATVRAAPPSPAAWDLMEAVNQERFGAGLPPLSALVSVLDLADKQATRIADDGELSHNPDLADDVANRVAGWMRVGENVGYASELAKLHSAFMASPPHRANILGDFNYIAITVVQRGDTLWAAEVFVKGPPGLPTLTRVPVSRVADASNVGASVASSRSMFSAGGSAGVVIARQDLFCDALAGGALAAAQSGPVLLSNRDQVDPIVVEEAKRVLKPGGTVAATVPSWLPEQICWALSEEYHAPFVEGGHVRIYSEPTLRSRMRTAGLQPGRAHHAHALHSPSWWLKCAVGPTNDDHPLVKAYLRVLIWDIAQTQPMGTVTRWAERLLNPVLGKSLVVYAKKEVVR
jgi:hypothetical protein